MGFDSDLKEFQKSFSEGNILTKICVGLLFFLALSSLTSLSSKVVEWKGFILTGLSFYQSFFVKFIASTSANIGLNYTAQEIHVATVSSISIILGMRVQAMGQIVAFHKINERYASSLKPNLTLYWFLAIALPVGIWVWYGVSNPVIRIWWVTFSCVFLPIFMTIPKIIMSKFGYEYFEKNEFSYFKNYYMYVGALLISICVLGAINSGLAV